MIDVTPADVQQAVEGTEFFHGTGCPCCRQETMMTEGIRPIDPPSLVKRLAEMIGGTITECAALPDGSGFATMSMPLPKDHWSTRDPERFNVPPMPFRMGTAEHIVVAVFPNAGVPDRTARMTRDEMADRIREAGRYAYRSATMNGKDTDLDPDALLQNLVVAFLGYWTENGLSNDAFANPNS